MLYHVEHFQIGKNSTLGALQDSHGQICEQDQERWARLAVKGLVRQYSCRKVDSLLTDSRPAMRRKMLLVTSPLMRLNLLVLALETIVQRTTLVSSL